MLDYSNIPHPLLSDPGTCQEDRFSALLNPDTVKIEEQSLEDILQFINKYARFVNFYDVEQVNNSRFEENFAFKISNWQDFFNKSLPFQLAALVKLDINELEANLAQLIRLQEEAPLPENVQLLIDFIFNELILIFERSLNNVLAAGSSFSTVLSRMMSAALRSPLTEFIALVKGGMATSSLKGIDFNNQLKLKNWGIGDSSSITPNLLSPVTAYVEALERNASLFINELRVLAEQTHRFLPQAIYPSKEEESGKIAPHVGLMLAFLQLRKRFVADLNDLTRRHLLYFYNDILQIKGRPARPDETYVVFQLQKQVETAYLLKKGTQVKDGKDNNKADIIFELEKDVVLDKAEVKELRTLFVNYNSGLLQAKTNNSAAPVEPCSDGELNQFIEGLYIAPKANSIDGVEEGFKEDPKNWSTLGARESKLLEEGIPKPHPNARLGLILASPVLYLNEGKRKIIITLKCKHSFNSDDQELISKISISKLFDIWFSGEQDWLSAPNGSVKTQFLNLTGVSVDLKIEINLMDDFESITFSDPEVLKEEIGTTNPSVKIELSADYKIDCPSKLYKPCCTLLHCQPSGRITISAYQILCQLEIENSSIDVEVCGVKNLIVQNDEALQDVNSPIYPFGTRPEIIDFDRNLDLKNLVENPQPATLPNLVGPNFYIGSKEILCKQWNNIWVNLNWKDKPSDFQDYYKAYVARPRRNADGSPQFDSDGFPIYDSFGLIENEFEVNIALLNNGVWRRENTVSNRTKKRHTPWQAPVGGAVERPNPVTGHNNRILFDDNPEASFCKNYYTDDDGEFVFEQTVEIKRTNFPGSSSFRDLNVDLDELKVTTRDGFLRFTLENQNFFHRDYAEALAIQMMAFGRSYLMNVVVEELFTLIKTSRFSNQI